MKNIESKHIIKNNLFKYATHELTQDAILCYLFNNYYSDNNEEKEQAESFIKKFIFDDEKIKIKELISIDQRVKKYGNIDICLDLTTDIGRRFLVLIEDKTSTFLSKGQLEKEIDVAIKINNGKTYDEIIYILFKTEENYEMLYFYNFDNYIEKYKKANVTIKAKEKKDFLNALDKSNNNIIIEMIRAYYKEKENENKDNILYRFDRNNTKKLDDCLKKISKDIEFFRPKGEAKNNYRTSINISNKIINKILECEKYKNCNKEKMNFLLSNYYNLNIEWGNSININIMLGISEEGRYLSWKELLSRNSEKYTSKKELLNRLIEYINNNVSHDIKESGQYKKININKTINLQIMSYAINNEFLKIKNEQDFVENLFLTVEYVYEDFFSLLKKYMIEI